MMNCTIAIVDRDGIEGREDSEMMGRTLEEVDG